MTVSFLHGHTALDFARYEGNDAMVDFILGL